MSSNHIQQTMDPPLPENLRGLDGGPIIPLTVDLRAISQHEADSYVAVGADCFLTYFPEGRLATTNELRANERVGPGGEFKVLMACNVTPDVWESRFAGIDLEDRTRPRGWRWIDSDCIYVYAVPGKTHRMVQWSVFNTLCNAMRASGISIAQANVIWNQPGDYSTPNGIRILTPDIDIKDRGQTIAVVEIEITHRTIPVLRSHAQNNLPW